MFNAKKPTQSMFKAMELFARWITRMWKLRFSFNNEGESYSDSTTLISIGWDAQWVLDVVENRAQWLAVIKGLIEHESAHMKFTSNSGYEDYYIQCRKEGIPFGFAQFVQNVVEDGRVNRCHVNEDPKSLSTIRWVNEVHYRSVVKQPPTENMIANVTDSFIQRSRCGKDLPNMPQEALDLLDQVQNLLDKGIWAESTEKMLEVSAIPIGRILADALGVKVSSPMPSLGMNDGEKENERKQGQGQKAPQGNLDPRVSVILKKKKSSPKPPKAQPQKEEEEQVPSQQEEEHEEQANPSQDQLDEPENQPSPGDDEEGSTGNEIENTEEQTVEELAGESLPEESPESSTEKSDELEEESENSTEDDSLEDGSEPSGQDPETEELDNENEDSLEQGQEPDTPSEDNSEFDESGEMTLEGSENESTESEETEQEPTGADIGNGFDPELNTDEDGNWADSEDEEESLDEDLANIYDDGSGDPEDEDYEEASDSPSLEVDVSSDDSQEQTEDQDEVLPVVGPSGDDEFHDLFAECGDEWEDIDREDKETLEKAKLDSEAIMQSAVAEAKAVAKGIHANVEFEEEAASPDDKVYETLYHSVENMIDEWVDLVKARIERKRSAPLIGRTSGYLDQRRAYQAVAFLNDRVFRQPIEISDKGDMAVYNLIDASGSMHSADKWEYALMASTCLVNALEALKVPHTVTSYCDHDSDNPYVVHSRLVGWEQEDKRGIGGYYPDGSNRDGYSIRVALEELKKRPEKVKILVQESDGLPASVDYGWETISDVGIQDTADAVQEARDMGIKVITLYFGYTDAESLAKAKYMYGDGLVVVRNIHELVYDLVDAMDEELAKAF